MRRANVKTLLRVVLTSLIVWAIYLLRANVWFRLYPVMMVAIAFGAFALSLRGTPLVERFARGMGEILDDRGRVYCRKVTKAWTLFLAVNFLVTLSSVFGPYDFWVLWNGLVSYLLMGALFLGEWLYRRRFRRG